MKEMLLRYLGVGAGGFCGAIARMGVASLFGRLNIRFPLGTLIINVTGCLFLGWFLTFVSTRNVSDVTRLAIGVGFVGAYTTFSTYIYDSSHLAEEGAGLAAMFNLIGSLVLGIIAVRIGILLAHWS